ncbi:DUF2180 family protein [Streptomyces sulphureus]|uniref:DUF2180 family protein n=1 Tax=Streptomyces sulphureus TaxID=47758 RepID=UPI00035D45EA|nr:DUF2180 family protein [Streptomyces sulphureus]
MKCYDCAAHEADTPSVAICTRCGVGACPAHTHLTTEPIRRNTGVGARTGSTLARRALCLSCHAAESPAG